MSGFSPVHILFISVSYAFFIAMKEAFLYEVSI